MKVIYIAGKYRGPTAWAIEQNIRAAEDAAVKIWQAGMVAMCPHANSRHMEGVATDEHFLAGTLELMRRCDAVLLVNNWEDSVGARSEVDEANRLGLPIMHSGNGWTWLQKVLLRFREAPDGYRLSPGSQAPGEGYFWEGFPSSNAS